jgi:hypothetical protein
MKRKLTQMVRELLRAAPDGMTATEIAGVIDCHRQQVGKALPNMPDAYIDRWVHRRGKLTPMWCVVEVPPDCPHPKEQE